MAFFHNMQLSRRNCRLIPSAIVAFIVLVTYLGFTHSRPPVLKTGGNTRRTERCQDDNTILEANTWDNIKAKYKDLKDDKFTVVMQTYKRTEELKATLKAILREPVPSLHEVVIVWNDVDTAPPANYVSKHKVPVRYRASPKNSLNQKFVVDPEYKTKALLLTDDDIYYEPADLEFAFQTWRKFGQDRLTGSVPRCATLDKAGLWNYNSCSRGKGKDVYAMVITDLSFAHIGFLGFYSSDHEFPTKVRQYVDSHFNCEDIALNVQASLLTKTGPLLVRGKNSYHNSDPSVGISRKPGHAEARSQCLNDFAGMVGCLSLKDETAFVGRGVARNTWLQVVGDVFGIP